MSRILGVLVAVLAVLFLFSLSFFTVNQRYSAIVFQFSEAVRIIKEPGFHFRIPLLQDVRYFDNRIQTIDNNDPARIQTKEKMNVKVDSFIKYRIVDVGRYYKAFGVDEGGRAVKARVGNTVNNLLRDVFGNSTVQEVVSDKREAVMADILIRAKTETTRLGVEVVDVRIKRVEFEDSTLDAVYARMRAEREVVANRLRAEGNSEKTKIIADADKQKEIVLAEAYRDAQKLKGEGDAKAASIYAQAYGQNTEFYAFYKSLEAYKATFANKGDLMVLDPSSEFFKYMKNSRPAGSK